ncbi:hypothetical protein D4764_19G0001840 [Takifugu flavidus]|uniref:Uncharacterized protein n=1 Tax=Takifugu flavidus TaxID=433684 RepID=A0A5C6NMU4_9TELE|nr:hypothetical protein D4764_19G0001840 [Takifugu flavidus]
MPDGEGLPLLREEVFCCSRMRELQRPPTGSGTESGDEAIGGRPSIWPPCLIASAWGESYSKSGSPYSVPDRPDGESGTEEEEPGPAPRKRQRCDRVLIGSWSCWRGPRKGQQERKPGRRHF